MGGECVFGNEFLPISASARSAHTAGGTKCSPALPGGRWMAKLAAMNTPLTAALDKESPFAQRMAALGVRDGDFEEVFVRSGGHGGQNVNKTSTCVMLRHRPTGLQVKCQETRQQGLNRSLAREMLLDKIEALRARRAAEERARVEKLRRQKRPRSRGAKLRMLADKRHRSAKKDRRRIGEPD
jgi:protein subunit release factor B